ncbi:hypothetical protein O6H91_23G009100 [Diphasiastrum complanatum]|uniref:Uncharacterized protein n=1 Tax=Diphasiastrum complanatum TaxID=34168 RepID=A0ACC2A7Y7_DIPCM|nr:hypothetical protein O6H91_23G009100 [Diphasiastrum complanatum]
MVKKIGLVWPYCPALKSTRLFHTHGHFLMSLNNCRQFWPSIIVIRPKGQKAKGAYASNSFHVFVLRPWETKVQEFSLYKIMSRSVNQELNMILLVHFYNTKVKLIGTFLEAHGLYGA